MTPQEQCDLEALHEGHKDFFHPETDNMYDVTNILDRLKTIDLSHGGGKLHDLTRDLFSDMKNIVGVILCAPLCPHTAIMIDALELFCAFVKAISDLQDVQYHPYLTHLFSIALDVYLQIHLAVTDLVLQALHHDTPDWRLKNTCPTHTYTLKDKPDLKFKMLFAMDGNDSLKCISREAIGSYESTAKGLGEQFLGDDHYLTRSFIDKFGVGCSDESLTQPMTDNDNPCTGRWKNMREDATSRMWGIFDEAGIFMAICRHGFSLVIADIVQSSEQAKYLIAIVSKLLDVFGSNLAGSYDIGCKFRTTLNHSTIGPWAQALNYMSLMLVFHGYVHHCLCQLCFLARYVDGLGLKDLEGCEHTFSKTNGLASTVHYASPFHCCQAIGGYIAHNDEHDVYQNLTTMILNNYKQALHIIEEGRSILPHVMNDLGIMDVSVFGVWLSEENDYLAACSHEPEDEMLQMEYWQKLVNLDVSWKNVSDLTWNVATPSSAATSTFIQKDITATKHEEMMRHHALENFEKDLKIVQDIKIKLSVMKHWVPEDEEWQTTGHLVANHKYQHCLDQLESPVIAWIFELLKMNQLTYFYLTGYKLCKHIAKPLKACSVAIHTALNCFNTTTCACSPPHPQLTFEEVVEYTFLTDFDLLCNATHEDISQHPWASPAAHAAMDQYFKVCHAEEEIKCLNVEICCIITYLCDEDCYMRACIAKLQVSHPPLTHQVQLYHNIQAKFTNHHLHLLTETICLPRFTGTTLLGESMKTSPGDSSGDGDFDDEFDVDEDEYGDDKSALTMQEIICTSLDGYVAHE
ncbi:hypothetical protein BKA83DRAFT_4466620 [Pisolithus microcarpus]|nr:hypothetical protein BKA83DRAFT_4466620 [Pisolithus microcarpus]